VTAAGTSITLESLSSSDMAGTKKFPCSKMLHLSLTASNKLYQMGKRKESTAEDSAEK